MVIDVCQTMHAATQFRSIMDQGIRKECGQRGCWTWAKVSGSQEEVSTKKIGCTGDWFMMKISATTSM